MYKATSEAEQFFTATGNHGARIKTNGTGFVGAGGIELKNDATIAELELERRKISVALNDITEEANSIKTQLAEASRRQAEEGVWAPRDWWNRAKSALRHKGRQQQSLQLTLGEINRRLRAANAVESDTELLHCLKEVAQEIIGENKWNFIFAAALGLRRRRNLELAPP